MQKNRKRKSFEVDQRVSQKYPVDFPVVVNMDDLAMATDEEVFERSRMLETDRQRVIDVDLDPRLWEDELAYIRRELQIRKSRKDAHDAYCREVEREERESEMNLPNADLDNSRFVKLAALRNREFISNEN